MGREHAPRVVYHVFIMNFRLFYMFRKEGGGGGGDNDTWGFHAQLSALLKRNKQAVAYAKHMVNNPRGMFLPTHMLLKDGTDFQFVVSHGGHLCMAGQLCMEPPCMAVPPIETQ